jgi:hypothetical protein
MYLLTDGGALVNVADSKGRQALHTTFCGNPRVRFISLLVEIGFADVKAVGKEGNTPLRLALLNRLDQKGQSAAVGGIEETGDEGVVREQDAGADDDDEEEVTPESVLEVYDGSWQEYKLYPELPKVLPQED